jgi:AcrR family transcriptional regulator
MKPQQEEADGTAVRKRILGAALSAFMEGGYAQTSTLEIATRARVSKRELYSLFGNKEAMLVACITERAQRMKAPADLPELRDRDTLANMLTAFGTKLLTETTDPVVVAVFRLAISEAVHAPKVAQALESTARKPIRDSLRVIVANAKSAGLFRGRPDDRSAAAGGQSPECRRDRATSQRGDDSVPASLSGTRLGLTVRDKKVSTY